MKKSKISKFFSLILIIGVLLATLGSGFTTPTSAQGTKIIEAKALTNHECDETVWHFIINQLSDPSLAPPSITVTWANGATEVVPLDNVTPGGMAHYSTTSHLDYPVTSATAEIYEEWDGQFNLSHGPCFGPTPTVTPTETETPTVTPTETDVPTVTPTNTDVPTVTPTKTDVPTPTQDPTVTPTETDVPTETPTQDPTVTPTETDIPTETPTQDPTVTPTETDVPTETPTQDPTVTPTETNVPTTTPTETDVPTTTPTEPPEETSEPTPVEPPLGGGPPSYLSKSSATVLVALPIIALVVALFFSKRK